MRATLVFPVSDWKMLLARKLKKIWAWLWNGFGGKIEPQDASIRHAACRELYEETGCGIIAHPDDLDHRAEIDFYSFDTTASTPDFSVSVYLVKRFSWMAQSTLEMAEPTWFPYDQLPFSDMLPADRLFIPKLLESETFRATVRFNQAMSWVLEYEFLTEIFHTETQN
jgi:8-oxo-dGTP pyrophosphatase MutT (NUDIX family)